MIERSLSSLESIVAGLRRDVDRLEKRPLCKGGNGPQTPPPPVTGSFGYVYLYQKATGKVFRATQDRIHPEVVMELPRGVADIEDESFNWESTSGLAQAGVWSARKGLDEFIVDFVAGTVSPSLPIPQNSFHHNVSYSGEYPGGKFAVIGEYRYGSKGVVNLYNTASGERLGQLNETNKFDVNPQKGSPIVTRDLPGGRLGAEVWDTTGGVFKKLRDVPVDHPNGIGFSETGCAYTGLFSYASYAENSTRFYNWVTGKEVIFNNKNSPNIAYNGWMSYLDGVRLHPDGPALSPNIEWGSTPPQAISPSYIAYGHGIVDVMGNQVLNLLTIPGFSYAEYGVIFDAQYPPPARP